MIFVDAMIWVYNCDAEAPEYRNVNSWLEGKDGKGVIDSEEMLTNTVVVMEVIHNLRRRAQLPPELVYDYVLKMIVLKNLAAEPLDRNLLHAGIHMFERCYEYGIGGRDAAILATMLRRDVNTIATHDKNVLRMSHFHRIDPTHHAYQQSQFEAQKQ